MGRIATILSFSRVERNSAKISDVKINPGGDSNITVEHFAPIGDDSFPLTTDYVVTNDIPRTGGEVATGYVDPKNTPKAVAGDKRIYARDANTGVAVIEIWLKNDGSGILSNANGSLELQANGDILINGVKIDAAGAVTIPSSLDLNGKELDGHDHAAGTPPGTTGPNN